MSSDCQNAALHMVALVLVLVLVLRVGVEQELLPSL
jgi:hypothetical protein